jgi:hypothetical protein
LRVLEILVIKAGSRFKDQAVLARRLAFGVKPLVGLLDRLGEYIGEVDVVWQAHILDQAKRRP